jgi:hypothetical protein
VPLGSIFNISRGRLIPTKLEEEESGSGRAGKAADVARAHPDMSSSKNCRWKVSNSAGQSCAVASLLCCRNILHILQPVILRANLFKKLKLHVKNWSRSNHALLTFPSLQVCPCLLRSHQQKHFIATNHNVYNPREHKLGSSNFHCCQNIR